MRIKGKKTHMVSDILSALFNIILTRVSSTHGGEYHSACPGWGGQDKKTTVGSIISELRLIAGSKSTRLPKQTPAKISREEAQQIINGYRKLKPFHQKGIRDLIGGLSASYTNGRANK